MSPVIIYFPVSPVAPPKRTTFDFDTKIDVSRMEYTLGDSVAETSEGDLAEDLNFLHQGHL